MLLFFFFFAVLLSTQQQCVQIECGDRSTRVFLLGQFLDLLDQDKHGREPL